jgi:acyl carrier protein
VSTLGRVAKVLQDAFGCDPSTITDQTVPEDITAWDSVGHMNLVSALEGEFGCQFEIDDIMEMTSVSKIIEILVKKGVGA